MIQHTEILCIYNAIEDTIWTICAYKRCDLFRHCSSQSSKVSCIVKSEWPRNLWELHADLPRDYFISKNYCKVCSYYEEIHTLVLQWFDTSNFNLHFPKCLLGLRYNKPTLIRAKLHLLSDHIRITERGCFLALLNLQ